MKLNAQRVEDWGLTDDGADVSVGAEQIENGNVSLLVRTSSAVMGIVLSRDEAEDLARVLAEKLAGARNY